MKLVELTPKAFETFVSKQSCDNFLQSREMFNRYQSTGREAYLMGLKGSKNETVLAALIVKIGSIRGQSLFSAPGGPILDYSKEDTKKNIETFLTLIKSFLKKHHGCTFQFSPNVIVGKNKTAPKLSGAKCLGEYTQCKWISVLNLSNFSSPEELFKTFRKGHRYSIKYTDTRFHLKTRELSRDELTILKSLAEKSAEKHNFHDQTLDYYESMFDAFAGKIKVLATFDEKTPIAAAMFVYYGHEIVYLYSGADPAYSHLAGSYAIQWEMLQVAFKNGFKRYNFYGVRPEQKNGVYEFKKGFRAEVEELWGTYISPISPLGRLYTARKKYHKFGELS